MHSTRARALAGLLVALLVAAATIAAYSAAFSAPFQLDDIPAIRQNASIQHLLPLSAPLHPPANTAVSGRPVVNLTFAVNYAMNDALGIDQRADPNGPHKTVGYHIVNVAIHLFAGLLLFGVARRTARRWNTTDDPAFGDRVALFTAALWVVHPIHTEAINYAVQRTELLVSAFYLLTFYASIRAWDASTPARRAGWYVAGVVACALGMASKEVMLTAPFVVVLYDRAFRAESWRALLRDRGRLTVYAALAGTCFVAIAFIARDARGRTVGFELGIPWYRYLYSQAWAVARYVRLLFIPAGLTFDYGDRAISGWRAVPGAVLLLAAAAGTMAAWMRPRWRWLGFLGAAFFLILAPSSSVVPINTEIAAERRVYLASAAVIAAFVIVALRARRRFGVGIRVERAAFAVAALALVVTSFARSLTYATSERLWRDTMAKAPDNPRAYVGLGRALLVQGPGRYRDAEKYLEEAIAVDSGYAVAWQSLGRLALEERRFAYAAQLYERALRLVPNSLDATQGMVEALLDIGDSQSAIPYLERLGAADPSGASLVTLANAYLAAGRRSDAIPALQAAIERNPGLIDAMWSLGGVFVEQGNGVSAIPYLETAVRQTPASLGLALLSVAYAQTARVDDAVRTAATATANAGDTAQVFSLAGRAMLIAERPDDAKRYLERALVLDPSLVAARENLRQLSVRVR